VSDDDYKAFYHHVAHAFDEPWMTLHNTVEGVVSYTNLLFIPTQRPFDLFHPDRKVNVKLYVNRVFVSDAVEGLLPGYLRFVRGIVDSPDLNLNISREMLQHDPKLAKIRSGLVKRVIGQLKKKAEKDAEGFAAFWDAFGAVLKEGLYEDADNRDKLLDIVRFKTTVADGLASVDDVIERMKPGQEAIYYIAGDDPDQLAKSPHLEGFRAKGVEVLFLTDPVDEFWVGNMGEIKGKTLKSVTRGGADLDAVDGGGDAESDTSEGKDGDAKAVDAPGVDALVAAMKTTLGDAVKDVRVSNRLRESAVCLVADETDMDIHLERLLREHNQLPGEHASKRILEINAKHPMVAGLAKRAGADGAGSDDVLADAAHLLLDQARILQGEPLPDAAAFSERFAKVMERGVAL
jgi:molecular chaperone HtpG